MSQCECGKYWRKCQKKQLKDIVRQQESPFLRGGGDALAFGCLDKASAFPL